MTNYASGVGSVYGFAQDRDGIVWAGTSTGLWRFDDSGWQNIGVEWTAPAGRVTQIGFDSEGILWALVGGFDAPKDLIYLIPGTGHFKIAGSNLSVDGFTWEPDRTVLTAPGAPRVSGSGEGSEERLPAYPVTKKDLQVIDRNNSVWISPADKPVVMRLPKDSLRDVQNKASPAISETYTLNPFEFAELVDREGNIWFGDTRGILRALARTSASMSFDVMTLEEIPFYNEDLDCPPDPPAVENMKKLIAESDGVLIATPEYNDGIPGVLKNALDWASRPAFQSGFKNKPVSIISSSLAHDLLAESPVRCATQSPVRGRFTGGVRAQYKLREALIAMQAHLVMGPEVVIGGVHGKVDHSEFPRAAFPKTAK